MSQSNAEIAAGGGVVERVARAICKSLGADPDDMMGFGVLGRHRREKPRWVEFEDQARAAIAAMRQMTEEIDTAFRETYFEFGAEASPKDYWEHAIDAALGKAER